MVKIAWEAAVGGEVLKLLHEALEILAMQLETKILLPVLKATQTIFHKQSIINRLLKSKCVEAFGGYEVLTLNRFWNHEEYFRLIIPIFTAGSIVM